MTKSFPSKALLLAAGLGERLRPLTLSTPKPLISIGSHLLIEYNLTLLKKFGVKEVMVNLHHLGEKIKTTLGNGKKYGLKIKYSEEKEILGTGGGIKNVESFFESESFIVMNADILLDISLHSVWETHLQQKNIATLVLSSHERKDVKRLVYLNSRNEVLSISENPPQENAKGYIFTGAQILEKKILEQLPPQPHSLLRLRSVKSCLIQDAYIPLLKKKEKLGGVVCEGYFRDLGTFERYEAVKKEFERGWPYTTLKPEDFTSE